MNKLIALLLALTVLFSLVACSAKPQPSTPDGSANSSQPAGSTPTETQPQYSEGLQFYPTTDGTGYAVIGLGSCTDTHIAIPDEYDGKPVTEIGEKAFNGVRLIAVTIPDSVTSIGTAAFSDCTGLTSITLPGSITGIGNNAFGDCTNIVTVYFNGNIDDWLGIAFGSAFSNPCSNGANLNLYGELVTSITIPDSVTNINDYAFVGFANLTNITIPDSVTSIGLRAFADCTGLTSITIPNSVTSIGSSAFAGCTGLTSITIPNSVTSIGRSAFAGCTGLTSITIPNSVTSIGSSAFVGCTGLSEISLPCVFENFNTLFQNFDFPNMPERLKSVVINGGSEIPVNAFRDCTELTNITILDGVTSIGGAAFARCTGLTSITIPDSVTSIGGSAFTGCTGLTSITIPSNVVNIAGNAFLECTSLTSITFEGTKVQWNAIEKSFIWDNLTGNYTIYCTDGEIEKGQ